MLRTTSNICPIPLSVLLCDTKGGYVAKKLIKSVGNLGENRADITEEKENPRTERAKYCAGVLRQAGEILMPEGAQYLGSMSVHFYEKSTIVNHPEFFALSQLNVSDVPEALASEGYHALKRALMEGYGRNEPKTRGSK